eukprot:NODE_3_length_56144_cov_0.348184.p13 type:complete len:289 gc:universal NODE_3_length_56144_cov_0.348184:36393-35527(-)
MVKTVQTSDSGEQNKGRNELNHEPLFSNIPPTKKEDFQLPYNIYKEFYRETESNYKSGWTRIKRNIYLDARDHKSDNHADQCNCDKDLRCKDDSCVNRCMFIECQSDCVKGCLNQRIRNYRYLASNQYKVVFNPRKGWAIYSAVQINEGDYVLEYTGEVISLSRFNQRRELMKNKKNFYFLQYQNRIIDAFNKGSDARFVNHSCDPNCHIEVWRVDNEKRIGLFASRDIAIGEEITYNYNYSSEESYPCFCGSLNCSGVMGKKIENEIAAISKTEKWSSLNFKSVFIN